MLSLHKSLLLNTSGRVSIAAWRRALVALTIAASTLSLAACDDDDDDDTGDTNADTTGDTSNDTSSATDDDDDATGDDDDATGDDDDATSDDDDATSDDDDDATSDDDDATSDDDDDATSDDDDDATSDDDDDATGDDDDDVPSTYDFASRFGEGSSIAYDGQVMRGVLILELRNYLRAMTAKLDDGSFVPTAGDVIAAINFYFNFDSATSGDVPLTLTARLPLLQADFNGVSTNKKLSDKVAGLDTSTDYRDWSTEFAGWKEDGVTSPTTLLQKWFAKIEALAIDRANGTIPTAPGGAAVPSVVIDGNGVNYDQLIEKFLWASIAYHQTTDDYLDDATEGKGLLTSNAAAEEGKLFTTLEHQWDEGFGYFGAARDYGDYTDDELANAGGREDYLAVHDSNGDGKIDLLTEYTFAPAGYAARRDRGAATAGAPTDYTAQIFGGYLAGRALITNAGGDLNEAQLTELKGYRDAIVNGWEEVFAANVINYANGVLRDMTAFGTETYDFAGHAGRWSECKAFALSLQFNPRKRITDEQFEELNNLIGQAPVLPGADGIEAYKENLRAVKELLADIYGFDAKLLGDDDGVGGI